MNYGQIYGAIGHKADQVKAVRRELPVEVSNIVEIETRLLRVEDDRVMARCTAKNLPEARKQRNELSYNFSEGLRLGTLILSITHTFK